MKKPTGSTAQLQSLLDLAVEGDEDAHNQLMKRVSERLLRLTRRMLWNYPHLRRWEQTDDIFQTASLRLSRSLADVQPQTAHQFFGLAATQIRRTLIDLARQHFGPQGQATYHHSDAASGEPVVQRHPGPQSEPEDLQTWAEFHEAVDRLPAEEREVFSLQWYGDLPQQEIATLLDISVSTVQRRLYQARHLIKRTMRDHKPASGDD